MRQLACFIARPWPLIYSITEPLGQEEVAVALKQQSLDPVPAAAAKEEKRSFFKRIHSVFQADDSGESVDAAP